MAKSNYGQIKKYENEILAMKEAGYTKRRIAEELALTKEQMLPLSPGYCKWLSCTNLGGCFCCYRLYNE